MTLPQPNKLGSAAGWPDFDKGYARHVPQPEVVHCCRFKWLAAKLASSTLERQEAQVCPISRRDRQIRDTVTIEVRDRRKPEVR